MLIQKESSTKGAGTAHRDYYNSPQRSYLLKLTLRDFRSHGTGHKFLFTDPWPKDLERILDLFC